ncbi:MAG: caspase family protein [Clostridiales bacterium]|jgi:hypothetical protein|nr:caspase family protein [Clostridiales bacterium]
MISAYMKLESDFMRVKVKGGRLYKAEKSFGHLKRSDISQKQAAADNRETRTGIGDTLSGCLPKGFLKWIERNLPLLQCEGLVLLFETPLLAEFHWEYVQAGEGLYWYHFPLMRSIPGSTYGPRTGERNPSYGFFTLNDLGIGGTPVKNVLEDALGERNVHYTLIEPENFETPALALEKLKEDLQRNDFLHIACHGGTGELVSNMWQRGYGKREPFCDAGQLQNAACPRVALVDACHSGETGTEPADWKSTLPGSFIKPDGSAVYAANIGRSVYGTLDVTAFASHFIKLFCVEYKDRPFVDALRETRKRQGQDDKNTQIVYVSEDWDITCPCGEIVLKGWKPGEGVEYDMKDDALLPLKTYKPSYTVAVATGVAGFLMAVITLVTDRVYGTVYIAGYAASAAIMAASGISALRQYISIRTR